MQILFFCHSSVKTLSSITIEINFEPGVLQSNVSAEVKFYGMTTYVQTDFPLL
jgi:hypothetical protein